MLIAVPLSLILILLIKNAPLFKLKRSSEKLKPGSKKFLRFSVSLKDLKRCLTWNPFFV